MLPKGVERPQKPLARGGRIYLDKSFAGAPEFPVTLLLMGPVCLISQGRIEEPGLVWRASPLVADLGECFAGTFSRRWRQQQRDCGRREYVRWRVRGWSTTRRACRARRPVAEDRGGEDVAWWPVRSRLHAADRRSASPCVPPSAQTCDRLSPYADKQQWSGLAGEEAAESEISYSY